MSVRVSVVVPTYCRPRLLARCLDALLEQDFEAEAYEVIVADDAASPATKSQVEAYGDPRLRYVAVVGAHGPAAARNAGWRAARGEIVAFTDDDCQPAAGWLRAGLEAFEDGVVGVQGRITMPLPDWPTDYQRNEARLEQAEFATANCLYRRSALEEVGGFDERFRLAWREDADLYFTLLERYGQGNGRAHFRRAAEAVVVHPPRPAPWGVSLVQQRKSLFNALLYKKHPKLYRELVQPQPPLHYYGAVAGLLLGLVSLLQGRTPAGLSGLGLWLILTAQFCARRLRGNSRSPRHVAEMVVTSVLIPPLSVFWRLFGAVKFRVIFL